MFRRPNSSHIAIWVLLGLNWERTFIMDQKDRQPLENERRKNKRFRIQAPAIARVGNREIWAFTRDVSSSGVYFSVAEEDVGPPIGASLEFVIKIPPTIRYTKPCYIQGRARTVRIDTSDRDETGIAAEILEYAIQSEMTEGRWPNGPTFKF